mgnify:CR=1 FL=1
MTKNYLLSAALIGLGIQSLWATEKAPMNVIFILCDDMGYGDLGCYGQKYIQTPHLDRMAREGMQFMQHYAGCPVSAPSRCSIMTGLHTGHVQIRGNKEIAPEGREPMGKIRVYKEEPFFAMLTYTIPHAELNLPHDEIYRLYEDQFEEKAYVSAHGYREGIGGYDTSLKPKASFSAMKWLSWSRS